LIASLSIPKSSNQRPEKIPGAPTGFVRGSAPRLGAARWLHQLARHVNATWALIGNQSWVTQGRLYGNYGFHCGSASWAGQGSGATLSSGCVRRGSASSRRRAERRPISCSRCRAKQGAKGIICAPVNARPPSRLSRRAFDVLLLRVIAITTQNWSGPFRLKS
jgi:hypothetical protein